LTKVLRFSDGVVEFLCANTYLKKIVTLINHFHQVTTKVTV